ncbi:MCE family protein [Mycolicibacter sinensis]|jgi:phospholipid/cholesterol/gamma-HCH transport system substrate-binding protein|uniref:Mammalian cell entry protein n=1 Tax=Mycolicibacter sinensis (strain JDM601) TaxID=875328 RepID=A0A1A2DVL7_MYCSD|nr:MCE family protein [Mycolicibacter sinensis]OBF97292.1 mammalian cell entry protein [Mycolicibacter sinensis]OBG07948.1 mammalian cell entry protein [Mycolicibacter sinensis]
MSVKSLAGAVRRAGRRGAALGAGALVLSGCQFGGLNSLNMPGTAGHGRGSYSITVQLPDVTTLPQNSPVMVDDVTVGSVSGLQAVQQPDGSFYAAVKLSLDGDVVLPANAVAKVAQTSLLGSQHIDLSEPHDEPPVGRLNPGDQIPLSRTGRYPSTEEVLSSLGVVVNQGNLGALQDITEEAYAAVAGRAGTFAGLLPRLAELTASLDRQAHDIIAAADGLNRVGATLARSAPSLARALDTMPEALAVLNDNRANIVDAFGALQRLATVGSRILSETKEDFAADIKGLYPVVKSFADNANELVTAFPFIPTFPFPSMYLRNAVRGDFLNVYVTFDLTLRRFGESVFTTGAFDPNMPHMHDVLNPPDFLIGQMANLSGQAADPFKIPPGTAANYGD